MSVESDSTNNEKALKAIANDMFAKTGDYLKAELEYDYKLLEEMNKTTANKYKEISQISANVSKTVDQMNDKYKTLLPNLEMIDKLEDKVTRLEQMAYAIDAYSKRLEAKYKQLERK